MTAPRTTGREQPAKGGTMTDERDPVDVEAIIMDCQRQLRVAQYDSERSWAGSVLRLARAYEAALARAASAERVRDAAISRYQAAEQILSTVEAYVNVDEVLRNDRALKRERTHPAPDAVTP